MMFEPPLLRSESLELTMEQESGLIDLNDIDLQTVRTNFNNRYFVPNNLSV